MYYCNPKKPYNHNIKITNAKAKEVHYFDGEMLSTTDKEDFIDKLKTIKRSLILKNL